VLQALFDAAVADLDRGAGDVLVEQQNAELNISLRLELEQVGQLLEFEPRPGTQGGPGIGGYRPELIFDDVIGRALAKAREGQARTGDGLAVFIVDISRLRSKASLERLKQPMATDRNGFGLFSPLLRPAGLPEK
jgi:hypothetical protein